MCTDEEYDDSDTDVDSMSDDEFEKYEADLALNAIANPDFFPWADFVKWYKNQLIQCIRDKK